jgi:DNA primase
MRDAASRIVGVHLRKWSGKKFAVPGSRNGLFLPDAALPSGSSLLIAEGMSDTAALLTLGFREVVGRPSCNGGTRLLIDLVRQYQAEQAIIVADGDLAGTSGADSLASVLAVYVGVVRIIRPPAGIKDARAWLQHGATAADLNQTISVASPWQMHIKLRKVPHG